jgi:hypothetical protein
VLNLCSESRWSSDQGDRRSKNLPPALKRRFIVLTLYSWQFIVQNYAAETRGLLNWMGRLITSRAAMRYLEE